MQPAGERLGGVPMTAITLRNIPPRSSRRLYADAPVPTA
jgi:hypothetical protein